MAVLKPGKRRPQGRRGTAKPSDAAPADSGLDRVIAISLLVLAMATAAALRWRMRDVPLERDEGEFAYVGQLIRQGVPPYVEAYAMKFPGVYAAYAAMLSVFGETVHGIRAGLLLLNAATIGATFWIGRRLFGWLPAAAAATTFAVVTLDRWSMASFGHATHFVVLPVIGAIGLLATGRGGPAGLAGAGALFGTAVLMKQHAMFFVPFGIWLAVRAAAPSGAWRRIGLLIAGFSVPPLITALVLTMSGALGAAWFWTVTYPREYVTQIASAEAWSLLIYGVTQVLRQTWWWWLLGAIGLTVIFRSRAHDKSRALIVGWVLGAGASIVPGFYFRPHYFIVLLPVVALLAGVAIDAIARAAARRWRAVPAAAAAAALTVAVTMISLVSERSYLFAMSGAGISRSVYGVNPFVESPAIAQYIREHTRPEDRIAVLGSEPQIMFLAQRRSATGHIYTYPLMEPQPFASRMQREMAREIEGVHPAVVIVVMVPGSWAAQTTSDEFILDWMQRYTANCYSRAFTSRMPDGDTYLDVFARKSEEPCRARTP